MLSKSQLVESSHRCSEAADLIVDLKVIDRTNVPVASLKIVSLAFRMCASAFLMWSAVFILCLTLQLNRAHRERRTEAGAGLS